MTPKVLLRANSV